MSHLKLVIFPDELLSVFMVGKFKELSCSLKAGDRQAHRAPKKQGYSAFSFCLAD
ncbi:MAG: hypothetical protein MR387_06210 [Phocaeicola plebeius]|nr:hypothetical protein [Phocaeicola plebeius]